MRLESERICPSEAQTTAYLAGLLAAGERDVAEAHAARCGACRATVALHTWLVADETPDETSALDRIEPRTAAAARALLCRLVDRGDASPGSRISLRT